ncbi:hypothetical protein D3C71_1194680 [compost metagenome]
MSAWEVFPLTQCSRQHRLYSVSSGSHFRGISRHLIKSRATHADRWQVNGFGLEVHLSGVPRQCKAQRVAMAALSTSFDYGFCKLKSKARTAFRILVDLQEAVSEAVRCRRSSSQTTINTSMGDSLPSGQ